MSQVTTETVIVTPSLAQQLLGTMVNNRPRDPRTVANYARLMSEGRWAENGETIKLNAAGELIDGQHRLQGVIESGSALKMLVVKGVNGQAFETIDTGKSRSAADLLALEGFNHTSPMSAAARSLVLYQRGLWEGKTGGAIRISPLEVIDCIRNNPDITHAVGLIQKDYKEFGKLWSRGSAAFLLTIARRQNPHKADRFFSEVSNGSATSTEAITFKLRDRLMHNAASRTHKLPPRALSSICVKAWVAFRDDSDLERLRVSINETFPVL